MNSPSYQIQVISSLSETSASQWNALLPETAGPFLRYEFLHSLEQCGCVGGNTGWQVAHLLVNSSNLSLVGAMPLYLKQHSYGEFVFDWAWAQAYEQAGMPYFPKALCAIPFTPVQGSRFLVASDEDIVAIEKILIRSLKALVSQNELSSVHILFPDKIVLKELVEQGFMLRDSVQFHWHNHKYQNFEQFLVSLTRKRRKNIRRERAQVASENIEYRHIPGKMATSDDWEFFFRCYQNTYLEHHSTPYLNESCFQMLGQLMPEYLHLIIASKNNIPIASSLLVVDQHSSKAYGRYWGALEHIPCLHFEVAYYQAIEYCIQEGIQTFEGGAQGEHKMARGFIPTTISSAHWIADEQFSKAVKRFLEREHEGIAAYVNELEEHSPLKSTTVCP